MPFLPSVTTGKSRYRIVFLFFLIIAGLVGNYCRYPLFLNIDFLFGSIFAMLALQFFGPGRGIVAAALIAAYTYVLWNHPYAVVIMTAETALVAWLTVRRKVGMVVADTLYWLLVGMPLVYLFYHGIMHVPPSNTYIVMTKQAVNGIANALVARLIFTAVALQWRSSLIPLADIIYNLLAFFVLFPALLMLAMSCRSDFNEIDGRIRASLSHSSRETAEELETWLANRRTALANLAFQAAVKPPGEMQTLLEQAKDFDANYQRIGLADKDGIVVASAPLLDETGTRSIGVSLADRPYFPLLRETLQPMLSEVFWGKIVRSRPIVVMLEPVVVGGIFAGYVSGTLNLQQVGKHLDNQSDHHGMLYTLIDRNSNVALTNRGDQKVLSPFTRGEGRLNDLGSGLKQWLPVVPPNTPISEQWKQSFYVAEVNIGEMADWHLILEQPIAPFQKMIYTNYTGKLSLLFLILLGALFLAEVLSRRAIGTLKKLSHLTQDLPRRLTGNTAQVIWPQSTIREPHLLVQNFQEMQETLAHQFETIQQMNLSLQERMEELHQNEQRYRNIFDNVQETFYETSIDGRILEVSPSVLRLSRGQYSRDDLLGKPLFDLYAEPEDRRRFLEALQEDDAVVDYEVRLKNRDGTVIECSTSAKMQYTGDGLPLKIIGTIIDIGERKKAEKAQAHLQTQLQQAQKMEAIGTLAGGIAHDFNNILGAVIGYAEMIEDDCPPDSTIGHFNHRVLQAATRAKELVKQILAFSRQAQADRVPLQPGPVVVEALKLLRATLPTTISIQQDIDPQAGIILADPTQVYQIVMNLCTNAFHAMEESGGNLTVSLGRIRSSNDLFPESPLPPGEFVHLSVRDSGIGMDQELREKIFDPYFTTKEVGKGTGLGLAMVHGIVRGYGGTIVCDSAPGQGTVFHVAFPVVEDCLLPETGQLTAQTTQVG